MPGLTFDNIFLTPTGIRLIDVGISAIKSQVGERLFKRFVDQELKEVEEFRIFFLSRWIVNCQNILLINYLKININILFF